MATRGLARAWLPLRGLLSRCIFSTTISPATEGAERRGWRGYHGARQAGGVTEAWVAGRRGARARQGQRGSRQGQEARGPPGEGRVVEGTKMRLPNLALQAQIAWFHRE